MAPTSVLYRYHVEPGKEYTYTLYAILEEDGTVDPATVTIKVDPPIEEYTISITVDPDNSGRFEFSDGDGTYPAGTSVTITAVPNEGYDFDRWVGDVPGNPNQETITINNLNRNLNLTAKFKVKENGGGNDDEGSTGKAKSLPGFLAYLKQFLNSRDNGQEGRSLLSGFLNYPVAIRTFVHLI